MSTPRRERLLDTAEQLFYREGFHATGIDLIQAQSGVAKTTLYKHFKSKDELILAVLERSSSRVKAGLEARTDQLQGQGVARILTLFEELYTLCEEPDFNGCLFNNAAAEFMYSNPAVRALAAEHMAWMQTFLARLLKEEGFEPEYAQMLLPLYEGLLTVARVQEARQAIEYSLNSIRRLLQT
ncbi:TetR/AcrR family transcriptional regulator [Marinobacterium weihaiense]|uniref:TetR/AcrR family transcriptional regulator n=1 Tax=Marinobacterium weihaiense TaxID=2851016 RepID=A0ABS6M8C3_9GAMM|nr:TetR/AcrR family transcriptional regulator [Marinobacterium weihaiense]MBV0932534.1 TetR/AcrR family transcriptional regulator [Marinobacterium weihaiense]